MIRALLLLGATAGVVLLGFWLERRQKRQDAFPSKRIRLIVPFAPGGESDTTARTFERAIEKNGLLPQPLVVINQKGAGGTIGSRVAKKAKPDGYTILLLHDAIFTAKASGKVPYGPEAFEPIAATGENHLLIAVAKDSPFRDLPHLLSEAKTQPGTVVFGVNRGAPTHFIGLQLQQFAKGAKFRFPQSGGGADRFKDLLGGHIHVTAFSVAELIQFRASGLRALAIMAEERHPQLKEVPTARELGMDIVSSNMQMWWAPRGCPRDRVAYLADVIEKAMQTEEVQSQLKKRYVRPIFLRGEPLKRRIRQRAAQIGRISISRPEQLPNVPLIVLSLLALVILLLLGQQWRSRWQGQGRSEAIRPAIALSVWMVPLLTVVYVMALIQEWLDFRPLTFAFVVLVGIALKPKWQAIPPLMLTGAILSVGLYFLFTQVVVVSLPGT